MYGSLSMACVFCYKTFYEVVHMNLNKSLEAVVSLLFMYLSKKSSLLDAFDYTYQYFSALVKLYVLQKNKSPKLNLLVGKTQTNKYDKNI